MSALSVPVSGSGMSGLSSIMDLRKTGKVVLVNLAVAGSFTGATASAAPATLLDWSSPDATQVRVVGDDVRSASSAGIAVASRAERAEHPLGLAVLCAEMRTFIDLPVQDLARMVGVGRRQFYNLLNGETPAMRSSEDERRLRLVHDHLKHLSDVGSDASTLRSAVLTPLPAISGKSFFEVAEAGDIEEIELAHHALHVMLQSGARIREQTPTSGTFAKNDPRWEDAAAVLFGDSAAE